MGVTKLKKLNLNKRGKTVNVLHKRQYFISEFLFYCLPF
jgi:hypothetical protein